MTWGPAGSTGAQPDRAAPRPHRVRQPRRWWPQKVRIRLALVYAALFFVSGSLLLGLTYGLVAHSLPASSGATAKPAMTHAEFDRLCTQAQTAAPAAGKTAGPGSNAGPAGKVPDSLLAKCKEAYAAGARAGSTSQRLRVLHNLLLLSLLGLGIMTIASAGAGWVVSGRVLRPVRAITETARRASEQHLGERIGLTGARDELRELADTFDEMLERLDQAFAAQRRFVADASHELRTPLTVMRTAIDVTLAKPSRGAAQLEAMALRVRRSVDRAEKLIDALLTLAISDRGQVASQPVDLATAAEDALDSAAAEISHRGLTVDADIGQAVASGDAELLDRMVGNLVDNAVRHNEPGGWIRLSTGTADGSVLLRIANGGPALAPDVVITLFEPFRRVGARTGSGAGVGLGLGLAIVRSIASAHGGTVTAQSPPGGGLDIRVVLPARDAAPG